MRPISMRRPGQAAIAATLAAAARAARLHPPSVARPRWCYRSNPRWSCIEEQGSWAALGYQIQAPQQRGCLEPASSGLLWSSGGWRSAAAKRCSCLTSCSSPSSIWPRAVTLRHCHQRPSASARLVWRHRVRGRNSIFFARLSEPCILCVGALSPTSTCSAPTIRAGTCIHRAAQGGRGGGVGVGQRRRVQALPRRQLVAALLHKAARRQPGVHLWNAHNQELPCAAGGVQGVQCLGVGGQGPGMQSCSVLRLLHSFIQSRNEACCPGAKCLFALLPLPLLQNMEQVMAFVQEQGACTIDCTVPSSGLDPLAPEAAVKPLRSGCCCYCDCGYRCCYAHLTPACCCLSSASAGCTLAGSDSCV